MVKVKSNNLIIGTETASLQYNIPKSCWYRTHVTFLLSYKQLHYINSKITSSFSLPSALEWHAEHLLSLTNNYISHTRQCETPNSHFWNNSKKQGHAGMVGRKWEGKATQGQMQHPKGSHQLCEWHWAQILAWGSLTGSQWRASGQWWLREVEKSPANAAATLMQLPWLHHRLCSKEIHKWGKWLQSEASALWSCWNLIWLLKKPWE